MEGELSMEVPLNNINPFSVSWLTVQLLIIDIEPNDIFKTFPTQHLKNYTDHKHETDLEFSTVLFPFYFATSEVEPGSATQGRWDSFLTAFFHLKFTRLLTK